MAVVVESGVRRFTVEEYHRLAEIGLLRPDERVELIRGVIREMSPKGKRHSLSVFRINRLFSRRLAGRAGVFVQDALRKPVLESEPEPDVVIDANPDPGLDDLLPPSPLLIIEVADSSLDYDRNVKALLYAEAAIPEYWIVNLVEEVLEVHRESRGGAYQSKMVLNPTDRVSPLAWPEVDIQVSELLPGSVPLASDG